MGDDAVKAFGQVVRQLRKERKLSQQELAFEGDIDRTFVSLLENGHKQPSLLTIFRLAAALQLTPSELVRQVEQQLETGQS